ncbi:E3 ubiquitin-protein ligase PPP1R11-like [Xenia sp. Carnegie-2017]|uniref:E3 ubiquitin-protein ligase PPP1R11-like n=1 Tax=Xenia sp. Carnegie-2017 TaxID=2897299 RepID=UPI001F03F082|nr:E3 ubiquitin-protein ligase PPP1R11-like [Xenia sp. Carnegie-2017]
MTKCQIVNEYLKFYGRKNVLLENLFYDMTDCQTSTGSSTLTEAVEEQNQESSPMVLKLRKPKPKKKVQWKPDTVDNEFMDKKSSKCCCVYEKPRAFGESSSESESENENEGHSNAYCPGHNKKHKHKHKVDNHHCDKC